MAAAFRVRLRRECKARAAANGKPYARRATPQSRRRRASGGRAGAYPSAAFGRLPRAGPCLRARPCAGTRSDSLNAAAIATGHTRRQKADEVRVAKRLSRRSSAGLIKAKFSGFSFQEKSSPRQHGAAGARHRFRIVVDGAFRCAAFAPRISLSCPAGKPLPGRPRSDRDLVHDFFAVAVTELQQRRPAAAVFLVWRGTIVRICIQEPPRT
jgi:hypothetical protein